MDSFAGERGTIYLRNIPRDVRDKFQAACALRHKPMNRIIVRLMKQFIKENLNKVSIQNKPRKDKKKRERE